MCHDNTKCQLYLCARHTTAWEIWNNFRDDINANKQTNVHIERQSTQNARKYYIIFFCYLVEYPTLTTNSIKMHGTNEKLNNNVTTCKQKQTQNTNRNEINLKIK